MSAPPRATRVNHSGISVRNIDDTLDRLRRIAPVTVTHESDEVILGYRSAPAGQTPAKSP